MFNSDLIEGYMISEGSIVGIVNPRSAGGATGARFRELANIFEFYLQKDAARINWKLTCKPGHAVILTRTALEQGAEVILSVGGDGTHSDVVNGFFTQAGEPVNPDAKLAVIPRGTGGDFRKSLGIGPEADDGIRAFMHGTTARIDAGRLEYLDDRGHEKRTHFINIMSMGLSGKVTRLANRGPKWMGGRAVYALATVRALCMYKNKSLLISRNNGPIEERKLCMLTVANGRYFGGGMKIAPDALLDDGLFDVTCVGDLGLKDFLLKSRHLYRGTHLALDEFSCSRTEKIHVGCESETIIEVDGEDPGRLPVTASIVPNAIEVFVREGAAITKN
jgi:YegS/Rv2252/BmrU family lipid kinase